MAIVGDLPFVLSLSKHENDFFSSLLDAEQQETEPDDAKRQPQGANDRHSTHLMRKPSTDLGTDDRTSPNGEGQRYDTGIGTL